MKYFFTRLIMCVLFASLNFFVSAHAKPEKCPTVAALQTIHPMESDLIQTKPERTECCDAQGFPYDVPAEWKTRPYVSSFGTKDQWEVTFDQVNGNRKNEIIDQIHRQLASLSFDYGPASYFGHWYCAYHTNGRDLSAEYRG